MPRRYGAGARALLPGLQDGCGLQLGDAVVRLLRRVPRAVPHRRARRGALPREEGRERAGRLSPSRRRVRGARSEVRPVLAANLHDAATRLPARRNLPRRAVGRSVGPAERAAREARVAQPPGKRPRLACPPACWQPRLGNPSCGWTHVIESPGNSVRFNSFDHAVPHLIVLSGSLPDKREVSRADRAVLVCRRLYENRRW